MLPIILALIDFSEDIGQIALTIFYGVTNGAAAQSYWWPALVRMSSTINIIKWSTVRVGSLAVAVMLLAIAISYISSILVASQEPKSVDRKVK
jgi:hypothetical protein